MDGGPRVSVIIPVYDDAPALALCLDALAQQDLDEAVEIVVVDNGSTEDLTSVVAERHAVRVLWEPRAGSYAARNCGIRAAEGDVLAFTDADCVPTPGWLRRGLAALDAPDVAIVAGRVQVLPAERGRRTTAELYDLVHAFPVERYVQDFHFGVTANLFARRSLVEVLGPFDERLRSGGDAEWCQRAVRAGHRIVYAHESVVRHPARRHLGQVVRKARRVTWGREQLRDRAEGSQRQSVRELRRLVGRARRDVRATWETPLLPSPVARLRVSGLACLAQVATTVESLRYRRGSRRGVAAPRS